MKSIPKMYRFCVTLVLLTATAVTLAAIFVPAKTVYPTDNAAAAVQGAD